MFITFFKELEKFLLDQGAIKVGVATKSSLEGGPSTMDFTYTLKESKSAICFALPLDKEKIRKFLAKSLPNGRREHELDNIETNIRAFSLAVQGVKYLEHEGFLAKAVFPNFKYREDFPGWEINMVPELSLKLVATRSGVGTIGWSGNIGLKGYGANIILGCIVTSAELDPTPPIPSEEAFCTKCKLCQTVCAFRMFGSDEEETLTLGGYTLKMKRM